MAIVRAVYENGVFRPTGHVSLPERCEVEFEPKVVGPAAGSLHGPTGRAELWSRFLVGLAYTALVAGELSDYTKCAFSFAFAAIFTGFLLCGGLGLWWLTLRLRLKDARWGQFGIGSLLFLMVFGAVFFGTVRWIVVRVLEQRPQADSVGLYCTVAWICLPVALVSIPFALGMMEAVLWTAVALVKRPPVRRWILGQRKETVREKESQD